MSQALEAPGPGERTATTADDLAALTHNVSVREIVVSGCLTAVPTLRLAPGQSLRGRDDRAEIVFAPEVDGLQLSADNTVPGCVCMRARGGV